MEDKITKFRKLVSDKTVRKQLVKAGLTYAVVYSWGTTNRLPSEDNAKRVADLLGVPLSDIPYYRTERVV